jgi:hypothetical protein
MVLRNTTSAEDYVHYLLVFHILYTHIKKQLEGDAAMVVRNLAAK